MIEDQVQVELEYDQKLEKGTSTQLNVNVCKQRKCGYEFRKMYVLREKLVMIVMVLVIAFLSVRTIAITTQIMQKNNENTILLEKADMEIQLIKDLQDEVNKTTTSNEIIQKASDNGLKINEDNVKVVE